MMRHATAPGLGDPAGFVLADCSTQRNIDSRGRAEAQRWGESLRARGITRVRLFSSRWCRALDTAREMALGEVRPLPSLDSFISDSHRSDAHVATLRRDLAAMPPGDPLVLVTHQINFTALTGIFPRSGEAAIIELPLADPVRVLARVPTP
ncbi:histidine phosphatase family protein [Stutzerimonas azotifigens]|uniref:Histidine phosphatase family protein n=1 Tax=Stutzerimonas azotifigens TaxID=291995 RepID=A0ABR5YY35_9GAMM|nr:histidine phosphatase family protein [Stutzerimonas azotifigens]